MGSMHRFRVTRTSAATPVTPTLAKEKSPTRSGRAAGPACDRCRTFKKKCSRAFPACQLCAGAGQSCTYSATASTQRLQARVDWLSQIINNSGTNIEAVAAAAADSGSESLLTAPSSETDAPLSVAAAARSSGLVRPASGSTGSTASPELVLPRWTSAPAAHGDASDGSITSSPAALPDVSPQRLVDAFFSNVYKAYPFIDRAKVVGYLAAFDGFSSSTRRRDTSSTILYLVMAIGYTTMQRAGHMSAKDSVAPFDIDYAAILQQCLCHETTESLQILVLLALYALFDPAGVSPWSIVGVVSHQAVLQGLTRKASDEDADGAGGGYLSVKDIELRHRLFWSIYVLDRMKAASLGVPMALTDENMDVPLPGLTVEEFASPERAAHAAVLQTSRHVIRLRQLEDRILRHIHFRKKHHADSSAGSTTTSSAAELARATLATLREVAQGIQADIENWYSDGCLIAPPPSSEAASDNRSIHSSITWLSARYYHLLLLLHYPCHRLSVDLSETGRGQPPPPPPPQHPHPQPRHAKHAKLLMFVQKHLQSTSVLFQQRQLPLNRVTLCRLLPVALLVLHGFVWCAAASEPFSLRDEAGMLAAFLEAFPAGWAHAQRAAAIVRQFLAVVANASPSSYEPLHFGHHHSSHNNNHMFGQPAKENVRALVWPHIAALLELMYKVLGRATSFAFQEMDDDEALSPFHNNQNNHSNESPIMYMNRTAGPLVTDGETDPVMDLRWAGLELDFL